MAMSAQPTARLRFINTLRSTSGWRAVSSLTTKAIKATPPEITMHQVMVARAQPGPAPVHGRGRIAGSRARGEIRSRDVVSDAGANSL